jgi:hypothetical protein
VEPRHQAQSTALENGPVEGHINRLKTLRRQMYGRAGVELLRARLLPVPTSVSALKTDPVSACVVASSA